MRRPRVLVAGVALAGGLVLGIGLAVALATAAGAGPADPTTRILRQPDGTSVAARLYGDEFLSGYETLAGFTLLRDAQGAWVFATADSTGRLVPTDLRPTGEGRPPASAGIEPHLRDAAEARRADRERGRAGTESGGGPASPPAIGSRPVLVILAEFADQRLSTTATDWSTLFFGPDRSVADYFDDASEGLLDLVPAPEDDGTVDDGIVTVDLAPLPHPAAAGNFTAFQATAATILSAIDPAEVDLASFDADGDDHLSPDELHLVLVPAGWEAAQACPGRSVWAHRGVPTTPVVVGGVTLGDPEVNGGYVTAGEMQCPAEGDQQATLGIWVHELGHDLGWIDLYDIDGGSAGVDTWSVMGSHWAGTPIGSEPPRPDPFSRMQAGWLAPTLVDAPGTHVLGSSALGGEVLQVRDNPDGVDVGFLHGSGTGEYVLVEHRTPDGYDAAIAGCGLLVWHVDESQWSNAVDDSRRVDLEEAGDGEDQGGWADAEDPFPATTVGNDAFTTATSPSADLNSGLPSGVALTDIELLGGDAECGPQAMVTVDPSDGRPPRNDRLRDALALTLPESGLTTARGNNVAATHQAGEPAHAGRTGTGSVWWSFRPPRNGTVSITSESTAREVVAVYTGPRVDRLIPVAAARGGDPGTSFGSAPAPESIRRPLTFPVSGRVRYLIAVDSRDVDATGIRLFLDYDEVRVRAASLFPTVGPGQRPLLQVAVRNTSPVARLRVDGIRLGGSLVTPLDCPPTFAVAPGAERRCVVRPRATGPAGAVLRGTVSVDLRWPNLDRWSAASAPWAVPVRR